MGIFLLFFYIKNTSCLENANIMLANFGSSANRFYSTDKSGLHPAMSTNIKATVLRCGNQNYGKFRQECHTTV